MVIFRENTEDIYAGIEWEAGSEDAKKVLAFLKEHFPKRYEEDPLPRDQRHRHQAGLAATAPSAWSAPPSSTPSRDKRKSVTSSTRATS
jgi:hypothetical protein